MFLLLKEGSAVSSDAFQGSEETKIYCQRSLYPGEVLVLWLISDYISIIHLKIVAGQVHILKELDTIKMIQLMVQSFGSTLSCSHECLSFFVYSKTVQVSRFLKIKKMI